MSKNGLDHNRQNINTLGQNHAVIPMEIIRAKRDFKHEFDWMVLKLMKMRVQDIEELYNKPTTSALTKSLIMCLKRVWSTGEFNMLNMMLDRILGKPTDKKSIDLDIRKLEEQRLMALPDKEFLKVAFDTIKEELAKDESSSNPPSDLI